MTMSELTVPIDLIPDAVITVDRAGVIQQVNRQLATMFSYQANELVGQPIEILLPERVRERHINYRKAFQARPTMRPMGGDLELFGRRKDGSEFPVDIMLNPLSFDGRVLAVIRDTSAAKAMSARLAQLAYSDSLTRLPNREALYSELEQSRRNDAQASFAPMAIALFDLDCFKEVNDTMGHSCGDQLLKDVAGRWSDVIGQGTRIYRLGGDEFVLTIGNCGDPRVAVTIVNALLRQLDRPFEIAGTVVFASACAGIALAHTDGADAEELIANGDMALYKAKANGRGSHAFYDKTLRASLPARGARTVLPTASAMGRWRFSRRRGAAQMESRPNGRAA
jgi:diguanylate cyclase (GGDEF)-like protein/PAS domain S-box-containing protein